MKILKLFIFIILSSLCFAFYNKDDDPSGGLIDSNDLISGTYDILRMQSMGTCTEDDFEDLNPCTTKAVTEFCVQGTIQVADSKMDLGGLEISVESALLNISTSVRACDFFAIGQRGDRLSDLIVHDIGDGKFTFQSKEKLTDCWALITIRKQ